MKNCGNGLGVTNISDLVSKEIYGICETKNHTKDELNTKSSRSVYVKNNIMTNIIKHCRGKNKKRNKSNRWIQREINDSRF